MSTVRSKNMQQNDTIVEDNEVIIQRNFRDRFSSLTLFRWPNIVATKKH